MKKALYIIISIIIFFGVAMVLVKGLSQEDDWLCVNNQWVKHGQPSAPQPTTGCGQVVIKNFADCAAAGNPVMESYPRQCRANGQTFAEDIGNVLDKTNLIQVTSLQPNQIIASPLTITGQARGYWFFEASFPVKLLDAQGKVIAQVAAQAQGDWMTNDFVPFIAILEFNAPAGSIGQLVLEKDNPSDLPVNADQLHFSVVFGASQTSELTTVKVYFATAQTGQSPDFDCQKVAVVNRQVPKTTAVARAALEELLKGPTAAEKTQGYLTSINPNVKIQKLTIKNNVAKADFDEQLEFQVGGSCRVANIAAQIRQTLLQFPSVKSVIISINGRTEDILQP